jgi:hypothetical protein
MESDGWQRQAEPAELADGVPQYVKAIGKLRLPLPPILNALRPRQTLNAEPAPFAFDLWRRVMDNIVARDAVGTHRTAKADGHGVRPGWLKET